MNKFGVALTVLAAMIGLACASELGFEHGLHPGAGLHGGHGGFGGHGLEHLEDAILFEELSRRGHRGFGRGGRLGRRSGFGRSGLGSGGLGSGGLGSGGLGGGAIGGGAIGGAAGGFRNQEGSFGALNAGSSNFEAGLAEKNRAGLLAGQKQFEAGQHLNGRNENEGLHKHQVLNSDKTIIKDRTTGVNDVDSFRNSNGFSEGSHSSGSETGIAAGAESGKIANIGESNRNVNAIGAQGSETSAAGAVGGAVGGGAVL